jgi:hypothetical protein
MEDETRTKIHIEVKSEIEDRQRDIAMFNTRGDEVVLSKTDDIINLAIDLTEKAVAEEIFKAIESPWFWNENKQTVLNVTQIERLKKKFGMGVG